MAWIWILYGLAVLVIGGMVGLHLERFRDAYTEMTAMMAGMTMGMLNGFMVGYAAAAFTASMFWGNLVGMLLGLGMGAYFGRAGSLMGIMDGSMGGVMGGSMGAMLAAMLFFPEAGMYWTAALMAVIYVVGMACLVALIEQSSPGHAALHRLMPVFTRAVATEAAEAAARSQQAGSSFARPRSIVDYYVLLGLDRDTTPEEIDEAYLVKLAAAEGAEIEQLERAVAILGDPAKRRAYDVRLRACCPPPRNARPTPVAQTVVASSSSNSEVPALTRASALSASSVAPSPEVRVSVKAESGTTRRRQVIAPRSAQSSRAGSQKTQTQKRHLNQPATRQANQPPISGFGVFVGVLLVAALIAWFAMANNNNSSAGGLDESKLPKMVGAANAPAQSALEAKAVTAQLVGGVQTVDFVVIGDSMSYRPNVIKIKQGMPVRFNVSVEGRDPG